MIQQICALECPCCEQPMSEEGHQALDKLYTRANESLHHLVPIMLFNGGCCPRCGTAIDLDAASVGNIEQFIVDHLKSLEGNQDRRIA